MNPPEERNEAISRDLPEEVANEPVLIRPDSHPLPGRSVKSQMTIMQVQQTWDCQLPPPQVLDAYKRIDEELFKFVLDEARKSADHQRGLETKNAEIQRMVNERTLAQGDRGQKSAIIVVICGFLLAGFVAYIGRTTAAYVTVTTLAGANLVGLILPFMAKQRKTASQNDPNNGSDQKAD